MEKKSAHTILLLFGPSQNHYDVKTFYIQISDVQAVFDQKSSSWMASKTHFWGNSQWKDKKSRCVLDRISPNKWVCLHFVVKIRLRCQNLLIEL